MARATITPMPGGNNICVKVEMKTGHRVGYAIWWFDGAEAARAFCRMCNLTWAVVCPPSEQS